MKYGCIEAGGTKFVCGICNEKGDILERIQFPTETPDITMPKVISFLGKFDLVSIGCGTFGPIDINPHSKTYGYITTTPKKAWQNYNIIGKLKKHFNIPIGFDTDVNGAALGEAMFGGAKGLKNVLYMTIGTGIGCGALVEGQLVHGMMHPEMGHIFVKRHPDDSFVGNCPYHKDCLEGLASGPAIEKRYHKKAQELEKNKQVWEIEGYYIAQALVNVILTLSPEKIIIGGGVAKQKQLIDIIRSNVNKMLNDYIQTKELNDINSYIITPVLKDNAGLIGALALAIKENEK